MLFTGPLTFYHPHLPPAGVPSRKSPAVTFLVAIYSSRFTLGLLGITLASATLFLKFVPTLAYGLGRCGLKPDTAKKSSRLVPPMSLNWITRNSFLPDKIPSGADSFRPRCPDDSDRVELLQNAIQTFAAKKS